MRKIDVKKLWPDEAKYFTPWLSDNLGLLSKVLGIDLEMVGREVRVGPYRADIIARDKQDGAKIVIENQLTKADPSHLGQLITYTSRLKAKTGVWVAPRYWNTNRTTVRFLNKHSACSSGFFAVKLSVFKSGIRSCEPVFDVIEHPKKWQDPVARDFWAYFAARRPDAPVPRFDQDSNLRRGRHVVKEAELRVVQYFGADFVRVYVTGKKGEADSDVFARINHYRRTLFKVLESSSFHAGDNLRCTTELRINTHDQRNWKRMADWLDNQRKVYESVLCKGASVVE